MVCVPDQRYLQELSELRKKGFSNIFYLDDMLLVSKSFDQCKLNIEATIAALLTNAGFTINQAKSVLNPSHKYFF